jgi:hypothetical protein
VNKYIDSIVEILSVIAFFIIVAMAIKTCWPRKSCKIIWEYGVFNPTTGISCKSFVPKEVFGDERLVKRPYGGGGYWQEVE